MVIKNKTNLASSWGKDVEEKDMLVFAGYRC